MASFMGVQAVDPTQSSRQRIDSFCQKTSSVADGFRALGLEVQSTPQVTLLHVRQMLGLIDALNSLGDEFSPMVQSWQQEIESGALSLQEFFALAWEATKNQKNAFDKHSISLPTGVCNAYIFSKVQPLITHQLQQLHSYVCAGRGEEPIARQIRANTATLVKFVDMRAVVPEDMQAFCSQQVLCHAQEEAAGKTPRVSTAIPGSHPVTLASLEFVYSAPQLTAASAAFSSQQALLSEIADDGQALVHLLGETTKVAKTALQAAEAGDSQEVFSCEAQAAQLAERMNTIASEVLELKGRITCSSEIFDSAALQIQALDKRASAGDVEAAVNLVRFVATIQSVQFLKVRIVFENQLSTICSFFQQVEEFSSLLSDDPLNMQEFRRGVLPIIEEAGEELKQLFIIGEELGFYAPELPEEGGAAPSAQNSRLDNALAFLQNQRRMAAAGGQASGEEGRVLGSEL